MGQARRRAMEAHFQILFRDWEIKRKQADEIACRSACYVPLSQDLLILTHELHRMWEQMPPDWLPPDVLEADLVCGLSR